jgi:predicted transporter
VSGLRRGARPVLKWFAAFYVVAIIVAIFLAGEGIFRLKNIVNSDDCSKKGVNVAATDCVGNSNVLDAHRALGTILVLFSILFLIVALIAWLPDKPARIVSIVAPILTFLQVVLAAIGGWVGGLHPVNAFLVLVLYGWLFHRLRKEEPQTVAASPPAVAD